MPASSPILFWLLLAATIVVDLVIFSWLQVLGESQRGTTLGIALIFGQLSAFCLWMVFSARGVVRWLLAGIAVLVAAVALNQVESGLDVSEAAGLSAAHMVSIVILLWIYKAATRRSEIVADAQFSMRDLLALMTIVAVVAALLGAARQLISEWQFTSAFVANNVLIAVATVLLWDRSWHWLFRLASALTVAIVCGSALSIWRPNMVGELQTLSAIQALTVIMWLAVGGIASMIRPESVAATSDTQVTPGMEKRS
jgi:hypothetical protein